MSVSSQKDTTYTKIFVGGLPYHTTDDSLKTFFEQFGDIDEAVVITDRQTAKSRGYGFVTMADKVGAERACKDPNPIIDGRKANVNLAYLGAKPRGIQLPETEALQSFPFALKAGIPGLYPTQFGLQPYMISNPGGYLTSAGVLPTAAAAHSTLLPTVSAAPGTAGQMLDYTAAAGYPTTAQSQLTAASLSGYEAAAAANYATAAAAGFAGIPAAYTYGVPQQTLGLTSPATAATHFQAQQLQERLQ